MSIPTPTPTPDPIIEYPILEKKGFINNKRNIKEIRTAHFINKLYEALTCFIILENRAYSLIDYDSEYDYIQNTTCAGPFEIVIKTNAYGTTDQYAPHSRRNQYYFPGGGTYDIDWGDGTIEYGVSGNQLHTYDVPGTYTIRVVELSRFGDEWWNSPYNDRGKILEVKGWGSSELQFFAPFYGATTGDPFYANHDIIMTAPSRLRLGADVFAFFMGCSINPDTSNWDTSNVKSMNSMFHEAYTANPDTSSWDTSNVEEMQNVFRNAPYANPDVSRWDMSRVTTVFNMFRGAVSAYPDVSLWDTKNIEVFSSVFWGIPGDPDVSGWKFDNAKTLSNMFRTATNANPDTSLWDTSSIMSLWATFWAASSANPDVSNWDTSNVETLYATFGASGADPDVSNWVTSKVKNLERTFQSITGNPNVSNWDTGNVENMSLTFRSASNANPDLSNWSLASVTTMNQMLRDSGISVENYSRWLIRCANWVHTYGQPLSIPLGANDRHYNNTEYEPTLEYKNAVDARLYLTTTIENGGAGWTIIDAGEEI